MKKKIIYSLIFIFFISGVIAYSIIKYPYSRGMRTGKLVKLSKKGFIFKTYEGILDLGSGDELTWHFSIRDEKIGEDLLAKTGRTIQLNYVEHLHRLFFNTKYNITSWKIIAENGDNADLLCRFVDVLRYDKNLVGKVRELILKYDEPLLQDIRNCQN